MVGGAASLVHSGGFAVGWSPPRRGTTGGARPRRRRPIVHEHSVFDEEDIRWMTVALDHAKAAYVRDEVPVGCVLVSHDGELIAAGSNEVEAQRDCTCHAEMQCLRSAMAARENWRLLGTTMYCTLEPCLMCLGAIQLARVKRLVYAADDKRLGAVQSWIAVPDFKHPFHAIETRGGLMAAESSELLKSFFRRRRGGAAKQP